MPIRVVCPQGHKILAPESRAGKRILCPRCRSELRVPVIEPPVDPMQETGAKPPPTVKYDPVASREQKLATAKKAANQKLSEAKKQRWKGDPSEGSGIGIDQKEQPSKSTAAKKQSAAKTSSKPANDDPKPPPRKSPPPLPGKRKGPVEKAAEPLAATDPSPAKESPSKQAKPAREPAKTEPAKTKPTEKVPQQQTASTEPVAPTDSTPPEQTQLDTAPSEEHVEPAMPVVGVRHRPERVRTVYLLALVLAGLACFGAVPSVMEWLDYMQSEGQQPLARWSWFSLVISGVQLAYALYLAQLPDWSSVWSTAIAALACAMLYAMLYAVTLLGDANSTLLTWLEIHATQTGRASAWCFVMLSVTGIFAYFCGRAGAAWRHSEQMRASLGLK